MGLSYKAKMISQKDMEIISHLRNNARKKITKISKEMQIPVTTAYDRIRAQEKRLVHKHVSLLNFSELGLHAKASIAIKAKADSKEELQKFLMQHPNVNSLSRVDFGSDFIAEVVFKNTGEVGSFTEYIQNKYGVISMQIYNVIQELKKEEFLTKREHFEVLR